MSTRSGLTSDTYTDNTNIYAHWISEGTVKKAPNDTKSFVPAGGEYDGFDLMGVQIRNADSDENFPGGIDDNPNFTVDGLRFVTVLSTSLLKKIDDLSTLSKPEYGYLVTRTEAARQNSSGDTFNLEYSGENVNGIDTRDTYDYVLNSNCTSVTSGYATAGGVTPTYDHFNSGNYLLYTMVIAYNLHEDKTEDEVKMAKAEDILARAYIRYTDANGLLRTYYNDYVGSSSVYGGCSCSYDKAYGIVLSKLQNQ